MTSVYHPRKQDQLGHGTPVPGRTRGSRDCTVVVASMGIDQLTRGALVPSVEELRRRMGKPGPVPTSTTDQDRAVSSYDTEMVRLDRRPLTYEKRTGALFLAIMRDAVKAGAFTSWGLDYGTFNREMGRTGDPLFTGGHNVGVQGWDRRREKGGRFWRVVWQLFDPLDDGRRDEIPDGARWIRPGPLLRAWADLGHFAGIFRGGEKTL